MANVTPTVTYDDDRAGAVVKWANLANGDNGTSVALPDMLSRTVYVNGTFGTSGNVAVQGGFSTSDLGNFTILTDPQGNNLSFTAAKVEAVQEQTRLIRPVVVNGNASTNLTVTLTARKIRT